MRIYVRKLFTKISTCFSWVPEQEWKSFPSFLPSSARSSVKRTGEMKSWYKLLRLEQFGSRNSHEICCYPFLRKHFPKRWKNRQLFLLKCKAVRIVSLSASCDVTSTSATFREISHFNVFNNFITSAQREKIATWKILDDGKSRRILACVRSPLILMKI